MGCNFRKSTGSRTVRAIGSDVAFQSVIEFVEALSKGLWDCSVECDCRIVFQSEKSDEAAEAIVFIDIGSHDEVY